jgi:hypothetical protein
MPAGRSSCAAATSLRLCLPATQRPAMPGNRSLKTLHPSVQMLAGADGTRREMRRFNDPEQGEVRVDVEEPAIDYARDALPRVGLQDLAQPREDEDGTITCGWALLHALEHAYLHLGHVQVTCQMWRQGEK